MSAHVSPNGAGGGTAPLGRLGVEAENRSPRRESPGLFWGALYVLVPVALCFSMLGVAVRVTGTWRSPGSSILEHPVALFMVHQKVWRMGGDSRTTTAPTGGLISDRAGNLPDHWSLQRKIELVLRLLRGEPIDAVSVESHLPVRDLENWERQFLEAGQHGLQNEGEAIPQDATAIDLH